MSRRQYAFVALVTAVAAWLRLNHLGLPSLWLDEILGFDIASAAAKGPIWRWLWPFEAEHGPLFHVTELAGRFLARPEMSARLAPALFGIATVVFAATVVVAGDLARRRAGSPATTEETALRATTSYVFPILLALSPLHIYYSREGRPYSLLILLAMTVLVLLLSQSRWVAIPFLLAIYTSALALPYLLSAAIASVRQWKIAAIAGASAVAIYLMYGAANTVHPVSNFPPIDWRLMLSVLESFASSAINTTHIHRSAYGFLLLAILGAADVVRRDKSAAWSIVSLAVFPVVLMAIALWTRDHWFAIRYVSMALPAYLLLVACGVSAIAHYARRGEVIVAIALAIGIVSQGFRSARLEAFQKLDWRSIASTLQQRVAPDDLILATNPWSIVCLDFYLRDQQPRRLLLNADESIPNAETLTKEHQRSWIVTAGYYTDHRIVDWACRYPIVLSSPLEDFRLHYAPSAEDFMQSRARIGERRAIEAARPDPAIPRLANVFIDKNSAWRGDRTLFPPEQYEARALSRFVARLGFDPTIAIPRLMNRKITIEDLAATLATDSGCMSDEDFMKRVYHTLVASPIDRPVLRDFLSAMKLGMTRREAVIGVLKNDACQRPLRSPSPE